MMGIPRETGAEAGLARPLTPVWPRCLSFEQYQSVSVEDGGRHLIVTNRFGDEWSR
jgi:hypothetical protein